MIEILEQLKTVTREKAKILQMVAQRKFSLDGNLTMQDFSKGIIEEICCKQYTLNKVVDSRSAAESLEKALNFLEQEQRKLYQQKNRKLKQRMAELMRNKSLSLQLQNHNKQWKKTESQRQNLSLKNLIKRSKQELQLEETISTRENQKQLSQMEKLLEIKQKSRSHLEEQQRECQEQMEKLIEVVDLVKEEYQELEMQILDRRRNMSIIKKDIREKQFELESLIIQNKKLKERSIGKQNCIDFGQAYLEEEKILLKQSYEQLKDMCKSYLDGAEEYFSVLGQISTKKQKYDSIQQKY